MKNSLAQNMNESAAFKMACALFGFAAAVFYRKHTRTINIATLLLVAILSSAITHYQSTNSLTANIPGDLSGGYSLSLNVPPAPEKESMTTAKAADPGLQKMRPKIKNEAAPLAAKDLPETDADAYITRFERIARAEQAKFGIPASISLAQGLIESRAGNSKLSKRNNNHFGMKCFSRQCRSGHCSNFTDDTHKDFFRVYKNAWESWRAHSEMISSGRYAKLKKNGLNYRAWAFGLKAVGYATDRTYAEKLIGVIERHKLYEYDRVKQ